MTDIDTAAPEADKLGAWLKVGLVLTVPYVFCVMLYYDVDIVTAFRTYLALIEISGFVIGILVLSATAALPHVKSRWPHLFEAPPRMPDEWAMWAVSGCMFACFALCFMYSGWIGVLMFWPIIFLAMTLAHIANWAKHQFRF